VITPRAGTEGTLQPGHPPMAQPTRRRGGFVEIVNVPSALLAGALCPLIADRSADDRGDHPGKNVTGSQRARRMAGRRRPQA